MGWATTHQYPSLAIDKSLSSNLAGSFFRDILP
jgi:hypothetical protein